MVLLYLRVLLLSSTLGVLAFAPAPLPTRCNTSLRNTIGDDDGNADTPFDVENSRRQLESMFSSSNDKTIGNKSSGETGDGDNDNDNEKNTEKLFSKIISEFEDGVDFSLESFPPPPPLSSIERDRRMGEIKLLECLAESDDAVSELWNHWYSERGSSAKTRLDKIGGLLTDPRDWQDCEKGLVELVDEYGIYFVEPVNLLATLYFLQGKLELSFKLCEIILTLKPYHIGALSGIVQVSLGMNDATAAREWAPKRLPRASTDVTPADNGDEESPPSVDNPRRVEWVKNAIAVAEDLLDQAEKRTKEDFFGKPETYYDDGAAGVSTEEDGVGDSKFSDDEIDGDAWQ